MCVSNKHWQLVGENSCFMMTEKTVRSSLIYPLRTAISTKSCCIGSLCNIFLSHLAAIFSIIFFSVKGNTLCFSWSKNTIMFFLRACRLQGGESDCGRQDSLESSVNRLCQILSNMGWGGVRYFAFLSKVLDSRRLEWDS